MALIARSKNGIDIRLTDERWSHIVAEHGELAFFQHEVFTTISDPDTIVSGLQEEQIAIREVEANKWMVVVYIEDASDGFVVTAFLTRRKTWWKRRKQIWP